MTITEQEIIKEFKTFGRGEKKYNYLIKLGRALPSIGSEYKIESNLIKGCQVKTWFHSRVEDERLYFEADSNSVIVRGFIDLLSRVFSGQKAEDIIDANLGFIDRIDLGENLSPVRANSLWKLVGQIKSEAKKITT